MIKRTRIRKPPKIVPVTPPGITIIENMRALGLTQVDLAERMGRPIKTINEIIKSKALLTPDTALQLEHVLGIPASFWLTREARYREYLARKKEMSKLIDFVDTYKEFPIGELVRFGWLEKHSNPIDGIRELMDFFGVSSIDMWKMILEPVVVFRKSSNSEDNHMALAVWLRKGEIEASKIDCQPFNTDKFKSVLEIIRSFTTETPDVFVPKIQSYCTQAGVAVVFVRELPGTHAYGAIRWFQPDKAIIQLSSHYKSNDQFWFSFFHEVGHLLFDGKKRSFVDYEYNTDAVEERANTFASNYLIPQKEYDMFCRKTAPYFSKESVRQFANNLGLSPGIVVGRLQHDGLIEHKNLNQLKQYYTWPGKIMV